MKFRNCVLLLLLVAVMNAVSGPAVAAGYSIDAQVDRTEVAFGESLQLVVTITQETNGMFGGGVGAPRISDIPGFDIARQSSSHNMTIVNGQGQVQIQTILELVPQGPGMKEIPALSVTGPDGRTHSTKPISINVLAPADEPEPQAEESPAVAPVEGPRQGIGFLSGILLVLLVIAAVIAAPLLFSWFINRRNASDHHRGESATAASTGAFGAGFSQGAKDTSAASQAEGGRATSGSGSRSSESGIEDAVIVGSGLTGAAAPEDLSGFDFKREVERLKRERPEVDIDFYREYFRLFQKGLRKHAAEIHDRLTPDEMMKLVIGRVPRQEAQMAKEIGAAWEAVAFARQLPGQSFATIHEQATRVLQTMI